MRKAKYGNKTFELGMQDFDEGTVFIQYNNQDLDCPMFQDKDGNIGFILDGESIYFTHLDFIYQ